jgi:DNA-binding CsgD family transcriptional regulator
MPGNSVRDFIASLRGLRSAAEFQTALDGALRGLGYSQFSYVGLDIDLVRENKLLQVEPEMIHMTNRPDWGRRYVDEDYSKCDPVVRECFGSRLPIRWTEAFMAHGRTREEATMMEDAWENGIRRGYTLPIHGPGGELGLLMLSSAETDSEFERLTDEFEYDLQIIAHHFHDAVQRTIQKKAEVPPPIPLTSREVEILKWTADGKTAWEIGQIVNISERTVNFHLRNIMTKFGVHNKTHAAAKAANLGLFSSHPSGGRVTQLLL